MSRRHKLCNVASGGRYLRINSIRQRRPRYLDNRADRARLTAPTLEYEEGDGPAWVSDDFVSSHADSQPVLPVCPRCGAEMPVAERGVHLSWYACWPCRVTIQCPE